MWDVRCATWEYRSGDRCLVVVDQEIDNIGAAGYRMPGTTAFRSGG